jgi:pimeloyl-ACP methyl ester carboxylesterase
MQVRAAQTIEVLGCNIHAVRHGDPAGLQPVGWLARLVCRRMAAFFGTGADGDPEFQAKFRRYYERDVLSGPAAAWRREEIIASSVRMAPILREAWLSFAEPAADIRHLAPKIACPVLFAWARRDRYVAWSRSRRAARLVPRHTVKLLEASHAAFLEQPAEFDAALIEFVDRLPHWASEDRA